MHIHLVNVVLFLHIGVAISAFAVAAILLVSMTQMRRAESVAVLRSWAAVSRRCEPMFPVIVLVLIALGAWLIHLSGGEFRWSDGWVDTAVVGLVIIEAYGGAVLAPAGKALHAAVEQAPAGPVPAELHAMVMSRAVWAGAYGNTAVALGILFLMPTKPSGPLAIGIVVGVGIVGVLLGLRLASAAPQTAAVPEAQTAAIAE